MTAKCQRGSCQGTIDQGFCDTCGLAAPSASPIKPSIPGAKAAAATIKVGGYAGASKIVARMPTAKVSATTKSSRTSKTGRSARTGSARGSRSSSVRRRSLGGGLVEMPVLPSLDPLLRVRKDLLVPCPHCQKKCNPQGKYCSHCGQAHHIQMLKPGEVVAGQYEIKGSLAFGGLGWIYLGMDLQLNRWVVLKGLLNVKDEAAAAAAVAERQFLAAVKHAKIVGVYNFVAHDGQSYIVMEYVGGRTIKEIRKERGALPPEEAISYILGILPAFGYLFSQGLVYCDFKPDNFMLEGDDVKLIDMGAVRKIGSPDGDVYGTKGYMAPEANDDPSPSSDLYTVGRTLMALMMDFDISGAHISSVPPPNELLHTVGIGRVEDAIRETLERTAGLTAPALFADDAVDLSQVPAEEADRIEAARVAHQESVAAYEAASARYKAEAREAAATAKYSAKAADGSKLPSWLTFDADVKTFVGTAPAGITEVPVMITAKTASGISADFPLSLRLPLAESEDLFRFLIKATHADDPDTRFQTADEMQAQLFGVLRGLVARRQEVPAHESDKFVGERSVKGGIVGGVETAWRHLPTLKIDQDDPAAADLFSISMITDSAASLEAMQQVVAAKPKSAEIRLRIADHLIERTSAPVDQVMVHLDAATELRPFDWRPIWYCGKLYLSRGEPEKALACFDRVYDQLPGEAAPKLALAISLEGAGRHAEAANLYEVSWRQDMALYAAPFGLGRSRLAQGDVPGGIEAYGLVPHGSPARIEAQVRIAETCMESSDFQGAIAAAERIPVDDAAHRRTKMAIVRKLTGGPDAPASASNLSLASEVLTKIQTDDLAFHEAKISLALEAVRLLDQGALQPDRGVRVLGAELRAKELRLQAEKSLRACARLVDDAATAALYVDRANAARPRTFL